MPKLSVIVPCYYNEENIPVTSRVLIENEAAFPADTTFEYVFVDDGSKDGTLAALYRFLIRHQHEDVVPLAEELQFADEYVYLLRHRFGTAYAFRQQLPPAAEVATLLLVPGTIQLLLENAIKHNAGNEDAPLLISLEATGTALTVHHARRPKRTPVESAGTGLANLRERYRLLFQQEIQVEALADSFRVTIPLLRQARRAVAAQPPVSA